MRGHVTLWGRECASARNPSHFPNRTRANPLLPLFSPLELVVRACHPILMSHLPPAALGKLDSDFACQTTQQRGLVSRKQHHHRPTRPPPQHHPLPNITAQHRRRQSLPAHRRSRPTSNIGAERAESGTLAVLCETVSGGRKVRSSEADRVGGKVRDPVERGG